MKKETFTGIALALSLAPWQTPAGGNDWENPEVNSINRLPPRTYAMPLADEAAALTDALEPATPYVRSLNGRWKFSWAGNPELRARDFQRTDFDDSDWFEIDVPSCVELKGFGSPGYTNVRYPHADASHPTNEHFAAILDRVSGRPDYNPVSSYRTRFSVPGSWKGRDVILRFDGVYSAYYVWVNGKRVGYAEDSKLPSEFDITPYLKENLGPGSEGAENLLCVEVYRWCDGSYFEDQDMFRFSGIFRDVSLWAKPKGGISDFIVKTIPVGGYEKWRLEVEVAGKEEEKGKREEAGTSVSLYDAAFKKVADLVSQSQSAVSTFSTALAAHAWSAEDPYLYTLVIRRGDDIRARRLGFKEQKIVGNRLLVNGRPVKFHGVNRHETSPENGRAITREEMLADVEMMKRANIDTVRTSHYPNHRLWYDLCDRYGLYVIAEANVEGHEPGYGERGLGRLPEWEHTIVERNLRHVRFYRNHPCVTLWSMGNETGHGDGFRHALAAVKALDPSRPTHWERGNPDADVDSRMYPWVYWLEERGKLGDLPAGTPYSEKAWGKIRECEGQSAGKPMILCEYAHAMGNAVGNLEEYWRLFYRYDALAGGCIWDWVDQAVWKETGRIDPQTGAVGRYLAYGGDFDETPNDGPFCCNGVIDAERHETAKLVEVAHVYRPLAVSRKSGADEIRNLRFELWNHELFTAANAYDGSWELLENGCVVRRGTFAVPPVAPLGRGTFAVPELEGFAFDPAKEYFVNFAFATRRDAPWAKRGFVVARDQVAVGPGPGAKGLASLPPAPIGVAEDDKSVTVAAGATKAVFCRASGTLCKLEMDGVSVLGESAPGAVPGPRLTCLRAFTDNDCWMQKGCVDSGLTQLRYHARPIVVGKNGVRTVVEVTGSKSAGFTHTAEWTFAADGSLTVANRVEPHGTMPCPGATWNPYQDFESMRVLPRLGLSLRLSPALEQVAYYGRGPRENYIDRRTASFVGLWRSTVTDLAEPYVRPQDNGMRTDVRWATFADASGRGVRFEMSEPIFLQALHCDAEDLALARFQNGQRRHRTPVPVRPDVYLNLDLRQTGLGGRSCGPEPMSGYIYTPKTETWTVRLRPASAADGAGAWKMFDRRLGLFVHWGIYAVSGWHEQVRMRKGLSRDEYAELAKGFTAAHFRADDLVAAAESAGARYLVVTAKHHDGFCLWDTKATDFNVMHSPCGRDLVRELSEACARRGLKLGFYYSNPDWNHPHAWNPKSTHQLKSPNPGDRPDMAKYLAFVKAQITELLTNYGPVCCLFWDIPPNVAAPELNRLARRLQPGIEINDRGWSGDGDYSTPERGIPAGAAFARKTEACDSVGAQSWGYRENEDYRTVGYLTRGIDEMLSRGGNYLLNVGPRADGTLASESLVCLKGVGAWYAKVEESYRNVVLETNLVADARALVTRRGKTVYVHYAKGLDASGVDLAPLGVRPLRATLLNTGASLKTEVAYLPNAWWTGRRPSLHVCGIPADRLANESVVLRLDFADGDLGGGIRCRRK